MELISHPMSKIVYCVDDGRRELTNAVFLVGAFMMLKMQQSCKSVLSSFNWLDGHVESYRDATLATPDFGLTLEDCWQGLERGMSLGWVQHPSRCQHGLWGAVDIDEYAHWDDPLNGDFHVVIPSKFLAFRGPQDLKGSEYSDEGGYRCFSPTYYVDVFRELGVTTVLRLNEPEYDADAFTQHGLAHHDLFFDDCTAPTVEVVQRFLAIADAARGIVAIHCKAGLGRTGTLIALYLMRAHGFGPREAMGWLRIMRPGSVIGEQQHYLCAAAEQRCGEDPVAPGAASASASASASAAPEGCVAGCGPCIRAPAARPCPSALAVQVARAAEKRCAVGRSGPDAPPPPPGHTAPRPRPPPACAGGPAASG
jgi:cell division cycle 14